MKNIQLFSILLMVFVFLFCGCSKDRQFLKDDSGSFKDNRDGKTYSWVKMGEQIWMAENLAYLPEVSSLAEDISTGPRYYVYGYTGSNVATAKGSLNFQTYGVLYNWPLDIIVQRAQDFASVLVGQGGATIADHEIYNTLAGKWQLEI